MITAPSFKPLTKAQQAARLAVLPKRIRHGLFTATFKEIVERWPGDPLGSGLWIIKHAGTVVGKMFAGGAYPWNTPHCSMRELVWSGPWPEGASDPRSRDYGMCFDTGPEASHRDALAAFAAKADRLMQWRREHARKSRKTG